MYVAFLSSNFFSLGSKKWQFSDFQAEKNESELKQKAQEPSQAEKTSARLGLITELATYAPAFLRYDNSVLARVSSE